RQFSKVSVIDTYCILRICERSVSNRGGRDRAEGRHCLNALRLGLFDCVLDLFYLVRYFDVCVELNVVTGVLISDQLFLESPVVETGNCELRLTTGPLRDRNITFLRVRRGWRTSANK